MPLKIVPRPTRSELESQTEDIVDVQTGTLKIGSERANPLLRTVTVTDDVATLPAASKAEALIVCVPLATVVESQLKTQDVVPLAKPKLVPSIFNETIVTA